VLTLVVISVDGFAFEVVFNVVAFQPELVGVSITTTGTVNDELP
jgi:hypothetical protein